MRVLERQLVLAHVSPSLSIRASGKPAGIVLVAWNGHGGSSYTEEIGKCVTSLKLARVGVVTPRKLANAINQGVSPHPTAKKARHWTRTHSTRLEKFPVLLTLAAYGRMDDSFPRWEDGVKQVWGRGIRSV